MRVFLLLTFIVLQLFAVCPTSIKCNYHNQYYVPKVDTEYRNGKQFGVYEHAYVDERGQQRKCRLLLECP